MSEREKKVNDKPNLQYLYRTRKFLFKHSNIMFGKIFILTIYRRFCFHCICVSCTHTHTLLLKQNFHFSRFIKHVFDDDELVHNFMLISSLNDICIKLEFNSVACINKSQTPSKLFIKIDASPQKPHNREKFHHRRVRENKRQKAARGLLERRKSILKVIIVTKFLSTIQMRGSPLTYAQHTHTHSSRS